MTQQELELAVLRSAVIDFLDQYYEDEVSGSRPSWPSELVTLVGWNEPDEIDK